MLHFIAQDRLASAWRLSLSAGILFGIWYLLSGKGDAFHLTVGAVGALTISITLFRRRPRRRFPVFRFAAMLPWYARQLLISNFRVARLVLSWRPVITPRFVRVAHGIKSEHGLTVMGCGVTLTPGTLSVEVESRNLLVHALDDVSAREVEAGDMARRVHALFDASTT